MREFLEKFSGCSQESMTFEVNLDKLLDYVVTTRKAKSDDLFQQSMNNDRFTKESECNTEQQDPDCNPMSAPQERNELVLKIELALKQANNGGKRDKRETPLQRRMKRAGASLTYNLLKREGDKEKLLMEYERRMGKCLSYLDEADCINEKEEEIWMKLFSGEEVDVKVKIHWYGPTGGLVFLLKQFRQEKLFSTPKMWSFWVWVSQHFVLANGEPAPDTLRKYHETEDTELRKTIRQAVDALVYR